MGGLSLGGASAAHHPTPLPRPRSAAPEPPEGPLTCVDLHMLGEVAVLSERLFSLSLGFARTRMLWCPRVQRSGCRRRWLRPLPLSVASLALRSGWLWLLFVFRRQRPARLPGHAVVVEEPAGLRARLEQLPTRRRRWGCHARRRQSSSSGSSKLHEGTRLTLLCLLLLPPFVVRTGAFRQAPAALGLLAPWSAWFERFFATLQASSRVRKGERLSGE